MVCNRTSSEWFTLDLLQVEVWWLVTALNILIRTDITDRSREYFLRAPLADIRRLILIVEALEFYCIDAHHFVFAVHFLVRNFEMLWDDAWAFMFNWRCELIHISTCNLLTIHHRKSLLSWVRRVIGPEALRCHNNRLFLLFLFWIDQHK